MTSSNGRRPTRLYRLILTPMMGLSAVALLEIGTANSHDPMRPELNAWFKSLKNKVGEPCCDTGDGQHVEAEWDMMKGGYKVLLKDPHRPTEPGPMVRRAILRRDRPSEPQRHRDGLVVAVLHRWKNDPYMALLHSGTGGMI
ncbi:hypothetical protein [Bradyrhizobium sp. RDI18]|uniref:hypothetical protein n=1 Tax=Bradyrhizobium sp. RDI18 TaxID=3367400 RepID=UPI00371290E4